MFTPNGILPQNSSCFMPFCTGPKTSNTYCVIPNKINIWINFVLKSIFTSEYLSEGTCVYSTGKKDVNSSKSEVEKELFALI